jgi:hypothetical protein
MLNPSQQQKNLKSIFFLLVLADTFAILIVAYYFGEYQYLLISSDNVRKNS